MNKFDKSSYRTDEKGTSKTGIPKMRTKLHLKCCISHSSLYSSTETEMGGNFRITIVKYIHNNFTNMSSIKRMYPDNG